MELAPLLKLWQVVQDEEDVVQLIKATAEGMLSCRTGSCASPRGVEGETLPSHAPSALPPLRSGQANG